MAYLPYLHFIFMAAAMVLVVTAALTARKKKTGWFVRHRRLALLGVVSALFAFSAQFTFKSAMHYPHLKSPHAFAGVAPLVLLVITPILGSLIASNPKVLRKYHRTFGKITSFAVIITALSGVGRFIQLLKK
jgi:hypothetical protein